ncbi:MAG: hypothetical protein K2X61_08880 [Caulobacteraceae bacterium]|nr:hypothetical protein [Caulobacteraceae bacterium]
MILPTVTKARFKVYFDCPDCGCSFVKRMDVVGLADCPECQLSDIADVGYGLEVEDEGLTR